MKNLAICIVFLASLAVSAPVCHAAEPVVYFVNNTSKEVVLIISRYIKENNTRVVDGYAVLPAGGKNGWSRRDGDFYFFASNRNQVAKFTIPFAYFWAHETENFFTTMNGGKFIPDQKYITNKYDAAFANRPINIRWGRPKDKTGYNNSQDLPGFFQPKEKLRDYGFVPQKFYKVEGNGDYTVQFYPAQFD